MLCSAWESIDAAQTWMERGAQPCRVTSMLPCPLSHKHQSSTQAKVMRDSLRQRALKYVRHQSMAPKWLPTLCIYPSRSAYMLQSHLTEGPNCWHPIKLLCEAPNDELVRTAMCQDGTDHRQMGERPDKRAHQGARWGAAAAPAAAGLCNRGLGRESGAMTSSGRLCGAVRGIT